MADIKQLAWSSTNAADFPLLASPLTATFTSQVIVNDYRPLWKLKIVVSAVSGTSPTLTPQFPTSTDGINFFPQHETFPPITATGTFWFNLSALDTVPDSITVDRTLKLMLVVSGTTPSFTLTSVQLFGVKEYRP